jgi:hypothetical protein
VSLAALAEEYEVQVASDNEWQRAARVLQAMWRDEQDIPIGTHNGESLGSRIETECARDQLCNYFTEPIRDQVRRAIEGATGAGKVIQQPRIYDNLLSSQPLSFNLFGELAADPDLASQVLREVWPAHVGEVHRIEFEFSPGRGDERFLGNKTAFDVFIECVSPDGADGFIGVEVKYHEDLTGEPADIRDRPREVARESGLFEPEDIAVLSAMPLQQIWLDHLLAQSMILSGEDRWREGLFVFLHPAPNWSCARAAARYERFLQRPGTFERRTLDEVVAIMRWKTGADWATELFRRYLDLARLEVSM